MAHTDIEISDCLNALSNDEWEDVQSLILQNKQLWHKVEEMNLLVESSIKKA